MRAPARCLPWLLSACALLANPACRDQRAAPAPTSVLLVVIDTLRADAVSAYGSVTNTTPEFDALAHGGVQYLQAWAPAPWTLPSHASLFTGQGVERHRVGLGSRGKLGDELPTLAERLARAGRRTAGFAENPLVSSPFGLSRGFERFEAQSIAGLIEENRNPGSSGFDLVERISDWARDRDPAEPFFLFANLIDPHDPYLVRAANPFLPEGASAAEAAAVEQSPGRICDALPSTRALAILRGLYLGDVAAADAKLGRILRIARTSAPGPLLIVVTSDHGEHLGEHRLLDHQFTLRNEALRIPLVVTGLPGVAPARIESPVTLADVAPSILHWLGLAADGFDGPLLPTDAEESTPQREILALYSDRPVSEWAEAAPIPRPERARRAACKPADRVHGDMAALIRYPFKRLWYAENPGELFDLRWDEAERTDQMQIQPALAAELGERLEARTQGLGLGAPGDGLDPDTRAALRALGYAP